MTLVLLPNELLIKIASKMSGKDITRLRLSCKMLYIVLKREFEKSKEYGIFKHNYYLSFHLMGCLNLLPENEIIIKYYNYNNIYKDEYNKFVISRISNIWPWATSYNKQYGKSIICLCNSEFCQENCYGVIDINLTVKNLRTLVKKNKTSSVIQKKVGMEKGFKDALSLLST